MRFAGRNESWQAVALVGALSVNANSIITECHLVIDIFTLIYVYLVKKKKCKG